MNRRGSAARPACRSMRWAAISRENRRVAVGGRPLPADGRRRQDLAAARRTPIAGACDRSAAAAGRCARAQREWRFVALRPLRAAHRARQRCRLCRPACRDPRRAGLDRRAPARLRLRGERRDRRAVSTPRPGRPACWRNANCGRRPCLRRVERSAASGDRALAGAAARCAARGPRGRGHPQGRPMDSALSSGDRVLFRPPGRSILQRQPARRSRAGPCAARSACGVTVTELANAAIDLRVAELLAARLCHDLIGPVAAVANGAELLADEDPEFARDAITLVGGSARKANRRLQFYRFVYGFTGGGVTGPLPHQLAADFLEETSIACDYAEVARSLPVERQKLACNLLAVAAEPLIRGGRLVLASEAAAPEVQATGEGARL